MTRDRNRYLTAAILTAIAVGIFALTILKRF